MRTLSFILSFLFFLFPVHSFAETTTQEKLTGELVGSWLVSVAHEGRTRLLKISEVSQGSGDTYPLTAVYGWSDGNQTPIKVEFTQNTKGRKLTIITPADTNIVASQISDTTYVGTFTSKNGNVKGVRISRVSETELPAMYDPVLTIEKPSADVPSSCAFYSGKWTGTWANDNLGQRWLWVTSVDSNCMATYYFGPQENPKVLKKTQIKDGVLEWKCTSANCTASKKGNSLQADYRPSDGDYNWIMLEKVQ